jgi:hypothetical protein
VRRLYRACSFEHAVPDEGEAQSNGPMIGSSRRVSFGDSGTECNNCKTQCLVYVSRDRILGQPIPGVLWCN